MGKGCLQATVRVGVVILLLALVGCASSAPAPPPASGLEAAPSAPPPPAEVRIEASEAAARQEAERRQEEAERNRFVYEDIFFAPKSYRLDERALEMLRWKADWLRRHPDVDVVVEGHTDKGGGRENNLYLGAKRAGAVMSYLLHQGIPRERLTAVSYGEDRPIAEGRGEEERAKNRRVRMILREAP
jgi:peptidoglycan-associated lipoprotein